MVLLFEGHTQAMQSAEAQSRKENTDVYVVKINLGGLRWAVTKFINKLPKPNKILNHYNNGNKIK